MLQLIGQMIFVWVEVLNIEQLIIYSFLYQYK